MTFAEGLKFFAKYINLPFNYLGFGIGTQVNPVGEGSDQLPNPLIIDGFYRRHDGHWYGKFDNLPASESKALNLENQLIEFHRQVALDIAGEASSWQFVAMPIDQSCNRYTTSSLNWVAPRRDPLVLDLDGNGITTSGINPNAPILFDQDGDGTLTATGWIASGEAIVVRDLDGDGTIDSGRELFGDNTILTHGPNAGQTAANGFAALADLDSNASGVADGKFDSADVAFSSVKLWKDLNQDGVSQSNELFTFAQLGIQSISVSGTAGNINLGGGNTQTFSGSFTRVGGQTGASGTAELAGSLLLANNNFYRQFTDDPAFTAAAQALPQMAGSGLVRDLRPAVSLGRALELRQVLATIEKPGFGDVSPAGFPLVLCPLTCRPTMNRRKNFKRKGSLLNPAQCKSRFSFEYSDRLRTSFTVEECV